MATVETETREVRAEARFVRTAPRKAQLVTEQIRGRTVPEARTILAFTTRDAARDVEKVLNSAVANAEANHDLIGDELFVSAAYASAGPVLKRWRARARGRVARIRKRTCHITVRLAPTAGASAVPVPRGGPAAAPPDESTGAGDRPAKREPRKQPDVAETTDAAAEKPAAQRKRAESSKRRSADKSKTEQTERKQKRTTRRKKSEEES
jgi:large subunit ribosomal protein L22